MLIFSTSIKIQISTRDATIKNGGLDVFGNVNRVGELKSSLHHPVYTRLKIHPNYHIDLPQAVTQRKWRINLRPFTLRTYAMAV